MLEKLIVVVEDPSMAILEHLLPKRIGKVDFEIKPFQCKDDLLKNLPRLRGYHTWLPESWAILVLVDRDNDDCRRLTLGRILQRSGYFKTGLRKMECARKVARHMQPDRN